MQKYGAYVVDVAGGVTNIRAQANAFDDALMTALWHDMGKITPLLQGVTPGTGSTPVTPTPTPTDTTAPTLQWVAANGAGININDPANKVFALNRSDSDHCLNGSRHVGR